MASLSARLVRVRSGLTPSEWTRVSGMAAVVVGLNVAGWLMLAAAVGGHYHISSTEIFGFGTGILAYTLGMRHAFGQLGVSETPDCQLTRQRPGRRRGSFRAPY